MIQHRMITTTGQTIASDEIPSPSSNLKQNKRMKRTYNKGKENPELEFRS